MQYTMMRVCRKMGMTYQTLKFYCNKGLVPNVKRDKNNRRVFDDRDLEWLRHLGCLKRCGLSIEDMQGYVELCLQGEQSIPKRKEILAARRKHLVDQLGQIQASIDYIDWKQQFYDDVLAGKTSYTSNLIDVD